MTTQATTGGELVLGDLRMRGLDLATVACSAVQSGAALVPTATALLCVSVDGMPPQELRVRVRPGAPARVQLEPGHPWTEVAPSPVTRCFMAGQAKQAPDMAKKRACRPASMPQKYLVSLQLQDPVTPDVMDRSVIRLFSDLLQSQVICLMTGHQCQRGKPV